MIDAALGAHARPVIEVVAAEQPVAAIELRAVIGRGHPAGAAFGAATAIILDTLPIAAFLALATFAVADAVGTVRAGWAVAIVATLSAGGAVLGGAANEIGAAFHPIFARIGFAQGAIVAFLGAAGPNRNAIAVATLLALAASTVTDAPRAKGARAAVAIVAAFGAIPAFATRAAEQILTAVALGAGTVGDRAGFTRIAAAGPYRDAALAAALLVLFAGVDAAAGGADVARGRTGMIGITALIVFASASEAGSAGFLGAILRRAAFGANTLVTGAAAFLLIGAFGVARSFRAVTTGAFVIGAALALCLAGIGVGATIFARLAIADARAVDTGSALAVTIGIGTALIGLAGPADAGLAKLAIVVATAGCAVVIGSTRVAAFLPGCAGRSILAIAIAIAERFTAFVFAFVRAIAVDAALRIAGALTAKALLALIEADAPVADEAGTAVFRIARAGLGIANRARVSTEILVDAIPTVARQGLARDLHTVALVRWHAGAGRVEPCRDRHTPHQTAKQPFERRAA
jgi:hypothetical protein